MQYDVFHGQGRIAVLHNADSFVAAVYIYVIDVYGAIALDLDAVLGYAIDIDIVYVNRGIVDVDAMSINAGAEVAMQQIDSAGIHYSHQGSAII